MSTRPWLRRFPCRGISVQPSSARCWRTLTGTGSCGPTRHLALPAARLRALSIGDMLEGRYAEQIRVLQRRVELSPRRQEDARMPMILAGEIAAEPVAVGEGDVHEALTGIHVLCHTKADLRYCLACAVVLNVWIEEERRAGFRGRKKFYAAFKPRVAELAMGPSRQPRGRSDLVREGCRSSLAAYAFSDRQCRLHLPGHPDSRRDICRRRITGMAWRSAQADRSLGADMGEDFAGRREHNMNQRSPPRYRSGSGGPQPEHRP